MNQVLETLQSLVVRLDSFETGLLLDENENILLSTEGDLIGVKDGRN